MSYRFCEGSRQGIAGNHVDGNARGLNRVLDLPTGVDLKRSRNLSPAALQEHLTSLVVALFSRIPVDGAYNGLHPSHADRGALYDLFADATEQRREFSAARMA